MANDIQNTPKSAPGPMTLGRGKVAQVNEQAPAARGNTAEETPTRDRISLTDSAVKLQEVSRRLAQEPSVDNRRIEQIRSELSAGTYEINADRIADRLLSQQRSLSGE
jgi:negative regulator of flagellin synthesis FlgM